MRVTPRNSLVLIRPMERKEQRQASGIIIPTLKNVEFELAEVVAVGRGYTEQGAYQGTDDLKPGMLVMYKAGAMTQQMGMVPNTIGLLDEGEKTALINQHDIYAIIERATARFVGDENGVLTDTKHQPAMSEIPGLITE